MKILVTGASGQLGFDVVKELNKRGYNDLYLPTSKELNLEDKDSITLYFQNIHPNIIIHCAAYTAVDKAEDEQEKCLKVNSFGTELLVEQAKHFNAKFLYISTDYVFDGLKKNTYKTDDTPNPQSVYGKSKYLGEQSVSNYQNHFIIRISWVFGKNGKNFIKTMLKLSKEKPFISIVNDQIGSPTYTVDVSKFLVDLMQTENYGIYHATNEGICSWFELTQEVFRLINTNTPIYPILTIDYPTKGKRPYNSSLDKSKIKEIGLNLLPDWKDAVKRFLIEIGEI
jgi:dTDP-4-dehydrorhamnose reductase